MDREFTSPREIIELNIEHYTSLLKTPLDETTRSTVERLLAAEKAKLLELSQRSDSSPPTSDPADRRSSGKSR